MSDDTPPKWARPRRSHPGNMLIGTDGQPVPLSPETVDEAIGDIIDRGELVLAVFRFEDALAVQTFSPPSQEIIDILEQTLHTYRQALRGITGTTQ